MINYIKLGSILLIILAVGFLVWDYNSLRKYKEQAKIELSKQALILEAKEKEVALLNKDISNLNAAIQKINAEVQEIKKVSDKEKVAIDLSKLVKVSNADNGISKGKDRLTYKAKKATESIFDELESISDLNTIK